MHTQNNALSLKRLPLAATGFARLRHEDQIYIDKTKIIFDFANLSTPCFLARPRRFGKSLLVDTLEDLFLNGTKNFENLDIANLWHDTTYKVIRLDFSYRKKLEIKILKRRLTDQLLFKFGLDKQIDPIDRLGDYIEPAETLERIANYIPDNEYVLLIDEYDTPMTCLLDNKLELEKP